MMDEQDKTERDRSARVEAEIADSFDEELEMELDDGRLARLPTRRTQRRRSPTRPTVLFRSCSGCSRNW